MLNTSIDFKEQMIEVRRTQILIGASRVFAQKGYHRATTKEIARAAGVAEGTIYNYFGNKRELLLAMVAMFATQNLKTNILAQPPDDPREFLTLILQDRYRLMEEHGHILAPLIAEIFSDADLREAVYNELLKPVMMLVEQYLQHHIDIGQFHPLNPLIVTRTLVGAMVLNSSLKLTRLDARYEQISPDSMIRQIVSLVLDGLLATNHE
jgi:AcrR family transcriptional regulator